MSFLDELDKIEAEKTAGVVPQAASVGQPSFMDRLNQIDLENRANSGSLLSGAKDTVANIPMAVTGLAKSFMDLGRFFTGDQPVINEFTGAEDPNIFKTGSKFIEDNIEKPYKQAALSDAALAQEERVSRAIDDPNVSLTDLAGILAANPRAVMMGAENSGLTMLAPGAVGATLARGAEKNLPLLGKLGAKKAMGLGVAGGNMALNAADTYGSTDDLEQADRLKGAGVSALATLLADRLTGGGADKLVAQILRGEGKLAGKQTARSVAAAALKGGVKSAAKEGAQEFIEEGGGALGEQVARDQGLDLNKIGKRGTFGAVLGALTGGAMGGVHSARQQRAENAVAADTFGEDFTPQQREEASNAVAAALKQMSLPTQPVQQPAPVQPEPEETAGRTTIGARLESNPEVVLQNRDRTSAASVTQMNQIAANPDYGRTGPSRDFGNGAPVVAYGSVPENQLGRTDYATTADGERIPVQYAVVDADSVLTSNNINGQTNKDYAAAGDDRIRAIAGNGRVTGLAEAYRRGTAAKYREELTADAAMSGVDPQVIQGMKSPILVRVMPKEKMRPDIGDISNTTGNMTMTATETAANDVNRLNFDNLTFDDNGNFDERTVRDFVRQMPAAEQAGLIEEKSGRPTRQAFERLQNALFKKAYGNDDLVRLAAQAADPEVRNVINALTQTAPKLARLEGLGNLDLRELVTQAAEVAVNAKRQGVSLEKYGRQQDMTIDPAVATILRIFAENPRSVKDMVRFLSDMADFAYAEGSKSDTDLFGSVPRATRADVLSRVDQELNDAAAEREATRRAKEALKRNDGGSPQTVEQSPGVRSAGENAPAATADGRGQGNAQPDQEGLTLTGETEAEAQANAAAKEKFEADEKKAREDAIAAEKADRLAKATKAGVDAAVDHFELTDDFTSDVDAVRGQKGLLFSKAGDRIKIKPESKEDADREEQVSGRTRSGQSGGLKYSQDSNWTPDQELIDKAKEHFGVTTNPEEAFYVLPDGTMLDGSGRHWGLKERDVNGRQVDHGDIAEIMDSDGAEAMYEFMGRTGAMRFDRIVGIASVARKPTAQQLAILGRSSKGGYLALSLNTPEGRIVDDTEFDSASPRLIEDFFAQALEKADRGVAGAWASRGKANAGSRTSEVTETLSTDPQIGASFRTLTDAGAVNVVETVDDLPTEIRSQIDDTEQSRSPMKSPRADIKRGLNAMARLIADHKTQYRAMFRPGLGWVDFEYGSEGSERIKGNGNRKGAEGILHIMEARYRKDGYNEKQIGDLLNDVVYAIADGRETSRQNREGENLKVTVENFRNGKTTRVALAKTPSSDAWIVTGFHVDGLVATGAAGKGHGNAGATHQRPTLSRPQKGAVATDSVLILGNRVLTIKHSDNGDIQGVYDPASGKSYLIASNLSKDTAKGVFLHEVGVHMANDSAMAADMQPLIRRAVQIVLNGNSNGDATSREVYRRMKAAGVINDRGNIVEGQSEEALAYLVETVANNPDKVSHPIREWFDRLIGAVRRWLYRHGFADATRLSDKDLAAVAVSNVRALAQAKKTKGVKFSKNPDEQKPATEAIQNRLDNGNPVWGYPTQQDEMFGEKPDYVEDEDGTRRTYREFRRDEKRGLSNEAEVRADEQMRAGAVARGHETPHDRLSDHSLVERDDFGNRKFGYGQWAYDHVTTATHMVFDAIDRASGHNLGFNPLPAEFRKIYRDYKSGLDKSARDIQNVAKLMAEMPVAERRLVSDVIEKMVPAGVNPPEHVVQVAAAISNLMDQQTDEMVRLGLLSKESAERWRGEYLPRIYLQQTELLKEARKDFHRIFDRGTAATGISGKHFKGRGRWRTVVGEKDIADHKSLGWEIRDPNWSDAQGELQFVGEGQQPKVPTVVMWRDFSPEERRQMGEERDALARVVLGYMESQQDIALARYFQSLAQDSRFVGDVAQEDWVKVPNTTISDTSPVKRYGALAGKYVSPEVWSELKRYNKDANAFTRVWKKLLAAWKEGKTALNPVAHMNNVIGNVAMAHFAGVDAWDTPAYYRTLRSIYRNDKDYQEAEAAGLFSGSWSRTELINLIPEDGVRDRLTGPQPTYEKALNLFLDYGTLGLRKPLRFLYEKEDGVFKYLISRDARAKGMSSRDAVDYANQFIFTYDDLPSGARFVRDTALPFFSWTYKAIPVLLRTAMLYPHRFLAPAASMFLANQLAYLALAASAAGDDDDWETIWQNAQKLKDAEDEALPEQGKGLTLFGNPKFMRLWNNQDGTANFLDVARLVPGGDLMDTNNQMGGMPWIQPLMPNSPVIGLFLALIANKDAFTGREVTKDTDSASDAFRKRVAYAVQNTVPALAPGGYHFSRLANAVAAETGTTFSMEPFFDVTGTDWQGRQQDMGKAVAHTLGVKVKPIDLEQEIQRKNQRARGEIKELRGQLRYKAKALARGAVSPEAYESFRERTVEDIRKRVEKMEEFNRKVSKLRK